MNLRALQCAFQAALLESAHADERDSPAPRIRAAILDAPPLSAQQRLDIYRQAYRLRLSEALRTTYPVLHQVLGDEDFDRLGADFVAAQDSVHRSIRWYGAQLADFAARTEPFAAQPVLAELARFEWALAAVFDAPDAVPVGRGALAALAPDAWAGLRVEFHPSLRSIDLAWNTVAVWQAVSDEGEVPAPARQDTPRRWLLWRRELRNYFRSLEPIEAVALEVAQAGESFATLCGALQSTLPDEEIPLYAARLIGAWVQDGLVTALRS